MALVTCKECSKKVSSDAEKCPHCGFDLQKEKEKAKNNKGFLIAFIVVVMIILAVNLSPASTDNNKNMEAFIVSQDFVSSELKTPSEAEFPTFSDSFVSVSGNTYTITSYVDSQNSFGAMLRSKYTCVLEYKDQLFYLQSVNIN